MRDIRDAVLKMGDAKNLRNEMTLEDVVCDGGGPLRGRTRLQGTSNQVAGKHFVEERFTLGLEVAPDGRARGIREQHREKALSAAEEEKAEKAALATDIPALPPMSTWVNVRTLGVKGDGATDDTDAIQKAINNHRVLYFPSGFYRLRGPLWLWGDSVLIGFSPFTTQFVLADHDSEFAGKGAPIPMVVAPDGGREYCDGNRDRDGERESAGDGGGVAGGGALAAGGCGFLGGAERVRGGAGAGGSPKPAAARNAGGRRWRRMRSIRACG